MKIGINGFLTERTLPYFMDLGVELYREGITWSDVETSPGEYDWSKPDHVFMLCQEAGVQWLPILFGPMGDCWQQPAGNDMAALDFVAWKTFVQKCIQRYRQHVYGWEIWQSPSCGYSGWRPTDDLKSYVGFAKETCKAIFQIDATARVLPGSIDPEVNLAYFSELFHYKLIGGIGTPTHLGIQFYYNNEPCTPRIFATLDRDVHVLRQKMDHMARPLPLIITEMGWPVGDGHYYISKNYIDGVNPVDEQTQCHRIERMLHYASILDMEAVFIHTIANYNRPTSERPKGVPACWGDYCGLMTSDLKARMSYNAVKDFIARGKSSV